VLTLERAERAAYDPQAAARLPRFRVPQRLGEYQ